MVTLDSRTLLVRRRSHARHSPSIRATENARAKSAEKKIGAEMYRTQGTSLMIHDESSRFPTAGSSNIINVKRFAKHPVAFVDLIILFGTWQCVSKEDAMMRKQFGQEWERWTAKVPYKLIPGVY
jgi:hypothetical protein